MGERIIAQVSKTRSLTNCFQRERNRLVSDYISPVALQPSVYVLILGHFRGASSPIRLNLLSLLFSDSVEG